MFATPRQSRTGFKRDFVSLSPHNLYFLIHLANRRLPSIIKAIWRGTWPTPRTLIASLCTRKKWLYPVFPEGWENVYTTQGVPVQGSLTIIVKGSPVAMSSCTAPSPTAPLQVPTSPPATCSPPSWRCQPHLLPPVLDDSFGAFQSHLMWKLHHFWKQLWRCSVIFSFGDNSKWNLEALKA